LSGSAALRSALSDAGDVLARQRVALAALGQPIPKSGLDADTLRAVASQAEDWREQGPQLLQLALSEIGIRQAVLDEAIRIKTTPDVAVSALVHAMHRIRTSIDVALGCSEEIAEISANAEVQRAASESAAALRLAYHYANELNDLSSLRGLMLQASYSPTDCGAAMDAVAAHLTYVAHDAGVVVEQKKRDARIVTSTNAQLLNRTLNYILLSSIVSPGVHRVLCDVRAEHDIAFVIRGDGHGATLEERERAGTFDAMFDTADRTNSADSSGFAVARRLADALGGYIVFESSPGAGDTLTLRIPRDASLP